jgi:hypothetical protein
VRRDSPDANRGEVLANLGAAGWFVQPIASASQKQDGVPDAIAAKTFLHLLEIKAPGGHLRPSQIRFIARMRGRGCYHVAFSSWEAERVLDECERNQAERLRRTHAEPQIESETSTEKGV